MNSHDSIRNIIDVNKFQWKHIYIYIYIYTTNQMIMETFERDIQDISGSRTSLQSK